MLTLIFADSSFAASSRLRFLCRAGEFQKLSTDSISGKSQDTKKLVRTSARVARWHIFKPKIPIWVNFGVSRNEK
jgi:hypothetical protein